MTKRILLGAFLFAGIASVFAKDVKVEKELIAEPCTITVTRLCTGRGTNETGTATSPSGDCDAAYIVAQQNQKNSCMTATIKKILELTPPDQP